MAADARVEELDRGGAALDGLMAPGGGIPDVDRAAALVSDLLSHVQRSGLSGWVVDCVERRAALDLPRRVAALAEAASEPDPDAAEMVVDTMAAIARLPPPLDPKLPCIGGGAETRWAEIGWRDEVWLTLRPRIQTLLTRAALAASSAPLAAEISPWPRAPRYCGQPPVPNEEAARTRYPGIAVGLTSEGADCRFRLPEGTAPDLVTMTGAVCWALWRSGVPVAEIRRFRDEMSRDRASIAETVGRWVSVDGNGMAGLEALRAATRPDHPWQPLLGITGERARQTHFLFCSSSEQALSLMRVTAGNRVVWHLTLDPCGEDADAGTCADPLASIAPSFGNDNTSVHECHASDGEGLRSLVGGAVSGRAEEIVLVLREPMRDAPAIASLARLALFGTVVAVVGADAVFREAIRTAYEDPSIGMRCMGEWDEVALDAFGINDSAQC